MPKSQLLAHVTDPFHVTFSLRFAKTWARMQKEKGLQIKFSAQKGNRKVTTKAKFNQPLPWCERTQRMPCLIAQKC